MKILVTGASGFIGSFIVEEALRQGMETWAAVRPSSSRKYLQDERIHFINLNLSSKEELISQLDGHEFDYVVHAAATKIVPTAEYNPFECIKTNINGAMNLIDACIDKKIKGVVALSTDKASSPINLYGATKLASDKLFVAANSYSGEHGSKFSVVRYGNVMGSRGSVIPFFMSIKDTGLLPITDDRMTRFMISLEDGVKLVWHAFEDMIGGEIYVKKIPSMKMTDLARVVAPDAKLEVIGIRPGEKLHEQMISAEDAYYTYEYPEHFKILPTINEWATSKERIKDGIRVPEGFVYSSDNNPEWMSDAELQQWIDINREKIGAI